MKVVTLKLNPLVVHLVEIVRNCRFHACGLVFFRHFLGISYFYLYDFANLLEKQLPDSLSAKLHKGSQYFCLFLAVQNIPFSLLFLLQ